MTLDEWLRTRAPEAPPALADGLRAALGDALARDASEASDLCLAAAERALRAYLPRCAAGTDEALELLTVDALVTYAFEAGAEDLEGFDRRARAAMQRIATLAAEAA
ncbi:MAG: hypothetical protein M3373_00970 [Gemmatimonadota bacterium]|nr:hypothetical protein [Gemmatimonadota bacterium]